jgi:hypothetical protein
MTGRNKGAAYKRLQARNKARRDAFSIHNDVPESQVSLLSTLVDYILEAIDVKVRMGLRFQYARRKEIIAKNRPSRKTYEIRNRGRSYTITIDDNGPITGISPSDYLEYGGPDPMDDEVDVNDAQSFEEQAWRHGDENPDSQEQGELGDGNG